ncbi:hypothetical protein CAPTEDRAFT_185892 [Capitella teleta]|uniref:G-protein coupled receptors family 1 profile domain-containing protein n=1 Tax=Capitella teleta TaxID=283909 RepID=R7TJG4_CAPTE|nr:hypothetical protein CAPTEDRAFT_185892 [Capitella teleta]|eukprot:ELT91691.1 hypothetical protein CAPTEDRAFT_185892 [Capitella teleta]
MSATTERSLAANPSHNDEPPERSDIEQAIKFIVLFCSLLTIMVNPFTITAVMTMKRRAINTFIISLCGADFITGMSTFLLKVNELFVKASESAAVVSWTAISLTSISFFTSMSSAFLIGLDRALAILRPNEYRTGATFNRGLKATLLVWFLNVSLIIVPLAVKVAYLEGPLPLALIPSQMFEKEFVDYVTAPLVGIWMIGNIVLYIVIMIAFAKVSKKTNSTSAEKRTRRLTKMSLIVLGALIVGNLPVTIMVSVPIPSEPAAMRRFKVTHDIFLIIMLIPTFVNNFIYAWNQPDFRQAYSRILFCRKSGAINPDTSNSGTVATDHTG